MHILETVIDHSVGHIQHRHHTVNVQAQASDHVALLVIADTAVHKAVLSTVQVVEAVVGAYKRHSMSHNSLTKILYKM
jgi:Zn-dependent protease with chaperone function